VIEFLRDELGLTPETVVADIGSGTGFLSELFLLNGNTVVGVEPNDKMRAAAEVLLGHYQSFWCINGTAEETTLEDASAGLVTAAQAFHWFDAERAVAEIHRALRPGGGLGLIWNAFDTSVDWVAALQALVHSNRRGEPQYGRSGWRETLVGSRSFGPIAERTFGLVQELDTDGLLARIGSTSYIATLPDAARDQLFHEIRTLVADLPRPLHLPYRTDTFVARAV
jgi:SAM-dependent methyltransferase